MLLVLASVAGLAVAGGTGNDAPAPGASARVPALAPQAIKLPVQATDHVAFEGASALAGTRFMIPPPRWLASHRATTRPTARLGGLGWQVDPYMK